jgi:outer membrane protein OmpA-like peptidoglycan-associated protein
MESQPTPSLHAPRSPMHAQSSPARAQDAMHAPPQRSSMPPPSGFARGTEPPPARRGRGALVAIVGGSCALTAVIVLLAMRACSGTAEPVVAKAPADAAPAQVVEADASIAATKPPVDAAELTAADVRVLIGDQKKPKPKANTGSGSAKRPDVVVATKSPPDAGVARETPEPEREQEPPPPPPVAVRERVRFGLGEHNWQAVPSSLQGRIAAALKTHPHRKVIVVGHADANETQQPANLASARANVVKTMLTSGVDRIPHGNIVTRSQVDDTTDGSGQRADVELAP